MNEASRLEAASVTAFRALRREPRFHGAPRRLLSAAGRAACDEVRHARRTRAFARRLGAVAQAPEALDTPPLPFEALAVENAIEGCVRETFGALLAHRQAARARDTDVRAAMRTIARDETRHAALAAHRALLEELAHPAPHDPEGRFGFVPAREALALLRAVAPSLWGAEPHGA